ncbi:MAG: arylsulfatase [Bacteroidota bacterium]
MQKIACLILCVIPILTLTIGCESVNKQADSPPNVILILTDDQGIGDLGCHGNPWLLTPNIDEFYQEAMRMTDFHVSPLCTPSRSAIMTGCYPLNNGAWATYKGRDALAEASTTIAKVFQQNGYETAMFGKWHLGDNYPNRPTDHGFDVAIQHLGGGVGELSDYWGNSYFDDIYFVNNQPKQFEGYCTDVWFEEAMSFIKQKKDKPFFVYLPTNAPHDPLIVAEKYAAPYRHLEGDKIISANLYGMIANIDENFGKFRQFLRETGLEENTILIYMSDNGTRFGYSPQGDLGYNKGFEGIKGSMREGGHRVPFFIRWPKGKIQGGKDLNTLAAHVDLFPTLAKLCGLSIPETAQLDGTDISKVLQQETNLQKRVIFSHTRQDWRPPDSIINTCIMNDDWRLINGSQLYNIAEDLKQENNLADKYPQLVEELLSENAKFFRQAMENRAYQALPASVIGHPAQKEICLTIQHAIGEDRGIWKCEQIAAGIKNKNDTHALAIEQAGWYEISCCRWPKECPGPIWGIPAHNPKDLFVYQTIRPEKATIRIANQILEKKIDGSQNAVSFKVYLEKGKSLLTNDFIEGDETYGVYYTYIKRLE